MANPYNINPKELYELASKGFGEATCAAMLGIKLTTLRKHLAESEELRSAFDSGSLLCVERVESTLLGIIDDPSATNRDKTQAATAVLKNNPQLTKRQIKAKAEALNELSTPELRAKLESLISRANDQSPDHNQDPLQLRLNSS